MGERCSAGQCHYRTSHARQRIIEGHRVVDTLTDRPRRLQSRRAPSTPANAWCRIRLEGIAMAAPRHGCIERPLAAILIPGMVRREFSRTAARFYRLELFS